ncbi:MAG: gliding motility lipoprotein GldD [Flavobacteriia bacterium]|nr:gliding motility lipoprotein GldD [Flavobacteriia bacterium]
MILKKMMIYRFNIFAGFFLFLALVVLLSACGQDKTIPKPSSYLRLDVEHKGYMNYHSDCGYSFDVNKLYTVKNVTDENGDPLCHRDISFNELNGTLHFSFIEMKEPLKSYIDYSLDKVDEHKVKANSIDDTTFLFPDKRVFGTLFELKGDVASPFQFYLTDSTTKFVSGVVYFNVVPNYDSLRPTLDFVKKDIVHMIETFKWQ